MNKLVLFALVLAGGAGAQTKDELLRNNFLDFTAPRGEVISQYEFETGDACYKFLASKGQSMDMAGQKVALSCGAVDYYEALPYTIRFSSPVGRIVSVQYAYSQACRDFADSIPVSTTGAPSIAPNYTASCK